MTAPDDDLPPPPGDELLARYREASALTSAAPSPALRTAVLAQARALAGQRTTAAGNDAPIAPANTAPSAIPDNQTLDASPVPARRTEAANNRRWLLTGTASVAVLIVAGLLVLQFNRGSEQDRNLALEHAAAPAPEPVLASASAAAPAPAPLETPPPKPATAAARRHAPPPELEAQARAASVPTPTQRLLAATAAGQREAARLALQAGAPPDAADAQGQTALMLAAARGDAPLTRLLLAAGADPRRADPHGLSAADQARRNGHAALARQLEAAAPTEK
jgi:Meckel syndrome type 1 protein